MPSDDQQINTTESVATLKTPEVQKTSPEFISETANPDLVKSAPDAD